MSSTKSTLKHISIELERQPPRVLGRLISQELSELQTREVSGGEICCVSTKNEKFYAIDCYHC